MSTLLSPEYRLPIAMTKATAMLQQMRFRTGTTPKNAQWVHDIRLARRAEGTHEETRVAVFVFESYSEYTLVLRVPVSNRHDQGHSHVLANAL